MYMLATGQREALADCRLFLLYLAGLIQCVLVCLCLYACVLCVDSPLSRSRTVCFVYQVATGSTRCTHSHYTHSALSLLPTVTIHKTSVFQTAAQSPKYNWNWVFCTHRHLYQRPNHIGPQKYLVLLAPVFYLANTVCTCR